VKQTARLIGMGWVFSLKQLSRSGFFILVSLIQPVIFASIAFFMFKAGHNAPTLLYAALGAGLMGIWSSTLFGSGGMIQWERWQGTLELLIAAPPPFALVVIPVTVATSTIGIYSLTATLLWGRVIFGIPLHIEHPFLFVAAIPATVFGLGLLGFMLASTFVLYRHANALSNLLEYPVWLVTGLLVPISLLPGWVAPLGWVLAPTWGVRAIRGAALGGDPAVAIFACLALGIVYLIGGSLFLNVFERLARERATLSLT
jgi:ABC-2 type transport system permease protein